MPLKIHEINSYDEHQNLINSLKDKPVFCWYVGARVPTTGKSWCGDCRDTEPIIRDYLNQLKIKNDLEVHVIYTELDRDYFKNKDCDFRQDPKIRLEKVPTLLCLKDMKTLVEGDCKDKGLLDMFFESIKS